jgi:hypothetical protein
MEIAEDTEEIKPPKNDYTRAWLFALIMLTILPAIVSLTAPTSIDGVYLRTLVVLVCLALYLDPTYRLSNITNLPWYMILSVGSLAFVGTLLWLEVQLRFLTWLGLINL